MLFLRYPKTPQKEQRGKTSEAILSSNSKRNLISIPSGFSSEKFLTERQVFRQKKNAFENPGKTITRIHQKTPKNYLKEKPGLFISQNSLTNNPSVDFFPLRRFQTKEATYIEFTKLDCATSSGFLNLLTF
jgi:hypothetical protein